MGQLIALILFVLNTFMSAFFTFIGLVIFKNYSHSHFFKIVIIPVLEGFIFTFLIIISEFSDSAVKTIKNAAELISDGML